jgi:hypothetical protein
MSVSLANERNRNHWESSRIVDQGASTTDPPDRLDCNDQSAVRRPSIEQIYMHLHSFLGLNDLDATVLCWAQAPTMVERGLDVLDESS